MLSSLSAPALSGSAFRPPVTRGSARGCAARAARCVVVAQSAAAFSTKRSEEVRGGMPELDTYSRTL